MKNSDNLPILRDVPGNDGVAVSLLDLDIRAVNNFVPTASAAFAVDGDFMVFPKSTVQDEHCLVIIFLPD